MLVVEGAVEIRVLRRQGQTARWSRAGFELSGDFIHGQQVIRKRQRVSRVIDAEWLAKDS